MQLQLTVALVPHLTAEEVSAFEAKCKTTAQTPEAVVASMIRQAITPTRRKASKKEDVPA